MIYVFGSILQLIRVETDKEQVYEQFEYAKHYKNSVSGKGALQALAAARSGAKTALVSKTGDDELARHILLRLRKHGVITSGIAKTNTIQTGTSVRLEHEHRTIIALGASDQASPGQIPMDSLTSNNVILLQTELDAQKNSDILQHAHDKGGLTILNASPRFEVSDQDVSNLDYLILSFKYKEKWEKLAPYIKANKRLTTIFLSPDGGMELNIRGNTSPIPKVKLDQLTWEHPEGYEDAFCGTFAASLYDGQPLDKAIIRAHIAAALTASTPGGYDAIPYSDPVDQILKGLEGD